MDGGPRDREREEAPGVGDGASNAERDGVGDARTMAEAALAAVAGGSTGGAE